MAGKALDLLGDQMTMMRIEEVAVHLGITTAEAKARHSKGNGFPKGVNYGGRIVRFCRDEVDIYKKGFEVLSCAHGLMKAILDGVPSHVASNMFICGVYFLEKENQIVYVGQSINVSARVAQHRGAKDFDAVKILPCKREELNDWEGFFIRLMRPRLNGDPMFSAPPSESWKRVISLVNNWVDE